LNTHPEMPTTSAASRRPSSAGLWARIAVVFALVGITIAFCLGSGGTKISTETGIEMDLPDAIDGFSGKAQEVSEAEKEILPKDTEFAKKFYTNDSTAQINAQIVLSGAEKRSIHRPEVCLPGQGWTIKSSQTLPIPLKSGHDLDVTMLRIARPISSGRESRELTSLFLYWFVGHGVTTPSHLMRIARTNLDVLLHSMNHRWAYVIVSAPVLKGFSPDGMDETQTLEMLKTFIGDLAPKIMKSEKSDAEPVKETALHSDDAPGAGG